jgi:hypothetical protein
MKHNSQDARKQQYKQDPAMPLSQLELRIPLCSSKEPTLGGSVRAVQERFVRRSRPRLNYTNLLYERLHYRFGSQVYTHLFICSILRPGHISMMCSKLQAERLKNRVSTPDRHEAVWSSAKLTDRLCGPPSAGSKAAGEWPLSFT